ncbi:MAG: DUF4258 domain-containing protein [Syntrophorhabdales bacterium]
MTKLLVGDYYKRDTRRCPRPDRTRAVSASEHGDDELANDGLFAGEIVEGFAAAVVVEDYPKYPCILTLQSDREWRSIHVVWGITER